MKGLSGLSRCGLKRRSFLVACVGGTAGFVVEALGEFSFISIPAGPNQTDQRPDASPPCRPLLFCTAYITPDAPGQSGQEATVARYPLVLVPQDTRAAFVSWRNRVNELNPSIVMLGYQLVIQETSVPGPGHDQLRRIKDAWCIYPGGIVPIVQASPSGQRARIYDPRKKEWQRAFLAACRATLASYPFHGLFLDQCTVYQRAHILESARAEMRQALQETLLELRKEFPNALLVGNSSYSWTGLNGELNEGRFHDMKSELVPFSGHVSPRIELYQSLIHSADDIETVKREMAAAHAHGAFYGASVDYQHVLWFESFNDLIEACRR
jgi:hypothetical protein